MARNVLDALRDAIRRQNAHLYIDRAAYVAADLAEQGVHLVTRHELTETDAERDRQDEKWGQQDHDDGTGPLFQGTAMAYQRRCERRFDSGRGTWKDVLLEEVYEALAESDPDALAGELVQVEAVCVAWRQALKRRAERQDGAA